MLKQGTISILIGCHSPIHSYYVCKTWYKLYERMPTFREIVCIFLHDIGHWGIDYLDNPEEKSEHWRRGAKIAEKFFGRWGFYMTAGHDRESHQPLSAMHQADKHSWIIASPLWQFFNACFEPKLRRGMGRWEAVYYLRKQVQENIDNGLEKSTHELYLERIDNESFK